jgi:hypothetical protein
VTASELLREVIRLGMPADVEILVWSVKRNGPTRSCLRKLGDSVVVIPLEEDGLTKAA